MCMGVYGMILGFLKLGFLLDFVSTPVLNGFISAAAITIGLGQVDSLLGEDGVRDGTAHTIHDIFAFLPDANGPAAGVGFGSLVILVALEQLGKRYAAKNRIIFYISILRAFVRVEHQTRCDTSLIRPLDLPAHLHWRRVRRQQEHLGS